MSKRLVGAAIMASGVLWALPASAVESGGSLASERLSASPGLYDAVNQLTAYFRGDLPDLSSQTRKTAVINYTQSAELPDTVRDYLLKRLEVITNASEQHPVRFVQCLKCLGVRAETKGDEVFIKKGITSDEELAEVLEDLRIRNYSEVHLAYTGDQLVMQVALYDKNKTLTYAKEYRAPYDGGEHSPWIAGVAAEAVSFMKPGFPGVTAGKVFAGQRIHGFGSAGLTGTVFNHTPELSGMSGFGLFADLSHNELLDAYWEDIHLSYPVDLGIIDFNAHQQLAIGAGVKVRFGEYVITQAGLRMHQFLNAPDDNTPVYNPKGKPIILNNEALPAYAYLGFGFEIL